MVGRQSGDVPWALESGRAQVGPGVGGRLPRAQLDAHGGCSRGDGVRGDQPGPGPGQRVRDWHDLGAAARRSQQQLPRPRRRPRRGLHLAPAFPGRAPAPRRPLSCTGTAGRRRAPASSVRGRAEPGKAARSPARPSRSNRSSPQSGPLVWETPFFQPKLWGCGSPPNSWEWGKGGKRYYLIVFELMSSSQITFLPAYHSASSCTISLPVPWVLEALKVSRDS